MLHASVSGLCLMAVAMSGGGEQKASASSSADASSSKAGKRPTFRASAIRYQVKDVDRAVTFYTQHLGFEVKQQAGRAFAMVSNESLVVYLSGPGSSGARAMPDGTLQEPGGWNRIVLEVDDLATVVATMKQAGLRFRNDIETGPGGRQIQLEDPDGNPIELFQPALQPQPGPAK